LLDRVGCIHGFRPGGVPGIEFVAWTQAAVSWKISTRSIGKARQALWLGLIENFITVRQVSWRQGSRGGSILFPALIIASKGCDGVDHQSAAMSALEFYRS